MKQSYIYIMTNKPYGTLYIGVTSNLVGRVEQHKSKQVSGITSKYNLCMLVYFECFNEIYQAITREKQLKNWHRQWKINLIEAVNPRWEDLSFQLR